MSLLAWVAAQILRISSSGLLRDVVRQLQLQRESGVERHRIDADVAIEQVKAEVQDRVDARKNRRDVHLAMMSFKVFWAAWILAALPVIAYEWKIFVWDKVLALGRTDALTGQAAEWADLVMSNLFYTGVAGAGVSAVGAVGVALAKRQKG